MSDNELIAEFMGAKHVKNNLGEHWRFKVPPTPMSEGLGWTYLGYLDSWDWLMPVVEKINKLWMGCGGDGDLGYMCDQVILMHINESISRVHGAVVHFIKWYNQQGVVNE